MEEEKYNFDYIEQVDETERDPRTESKVIAFLNSLL